VSAYGRLDGALIGLAETPEGEIGRFGTVTGLREEDSTILAITELKEKPDLDYAREYLRVADMPSDRYYTVFGLYILPPRLTAILAEMEADGAYDRGELQLTGALDRLRSEQGMRGLPILGRKIDIGVPAEFAGVFEGGCRA